MGKPRAELDAMLVELEHQMPELIAKYPPDGATFLDAFAGIADQIADSAGPEDSEHVRSRIDCILGSFGLIPSDNEGEPCDDQQTSENS